MLKVAADTSFIISILIERGTTQKAVKLLKKITKTSNKIYIPFQVITELVYVLEGIHKYTENMKKFTKEDIKEYVVAVLTTPEFAVENIKIGFNAINLYTEKNIDFGDAVIISNIYEKEIKKIVTLDEDYKKIEWLEIVE